MTTPDNGSPPMAPEDTLAQVVASTCLTLRAMWDSFGRSMQLMNFPQQVNAATFALFQVLINLMAVQEQSTFYTGMLQRFDQLLARTEATGAIDPKAVEQEIAARNVAVAMGPDPAVLEELMRQAHHRNAVDNGQLETLKQTGRELRLALTILRDALQHQRDAGARQVSEQEICETLEQALQMLTPHDQDPGGIPLGIPLDGTLTP